MSRETMSNGLLAIFCVIVGLLGMGLIALFFDDPSAFCFVIVYMVGGWVTRVLSKAIDELKIPE